MFSKIKCDVMYGVLSVCFCDNEVFSPQTLTLGWIMKEPRGIKTLTLFPLIKIWQKEYYLTGHSPIKTAFREPVTKTGHNSQPGCFFILHIYIEAVENLFGFVVALFETQFPTL